MSASSLPDETTDAHGLEGLERWATGEPEAERLRALERTDLLNAKSGDMFDRYARIAAALASTSVATVTLVTTDTLRFIARVGLEDEHTERAGTFCDVAMRRPGVVVVEDALDEPAFRDVGLAQGFRFYAAFPLLVGGGHRIGSLCVYDPKPMALTDDQLAALSDLTAVLTREIDTNHLAEIRADREAAATAAKVEIQHQMRNMFAKLSAMVAMTAREEGLSAEAVAAATRRRVLALSQANEVALRHRFEPAPMHELMAAAVAPATGRAPVAPALTGTDCALGSAAASVLVPLFDEIAFDAVRRGALAEGAEVALSWSAAADAFTIVWTERGGGAAAPDDLFRSAYVRTDAPLALRGEAEVKATAQGTSYTLRLPRTLVS